MTHAGTTPSLYERLGGLYGISGAVDVLADRLYDRWFGDMFPAVALLAAGQMSGLAVGAWTLVVGGDAWIFVDLILAVALITMLARRSDVAPHRGARRMAG